MYFIMYLFKKINSVNYMMNKFRDQELLLHDLQKFMCSKETYFLVQGSAGTGKTHTIGTFLNIGWGANIVTGPTHKSVTVLRETLEARGVHSDAYTLHRLLHYQHDYDDNGNDKFEPNRYSWTSYIEKYDEQRLILVLDEASMIDDVLEANIDDFVSFLNSSGLTIKVIVMGDMYQLPPVGYTTISNLFQIKQSAHLHNIIRSDNKHILECYKIFRDNVLYGDCDKFRNEFLHFITTAPNTVIRVCDKYDYERYLKNMFVKKRDEKNIILGACNKPIREYNEHIIKLLYPDSKTKYNVGQQLYYKRHCMYPIKSNTCDVIVVNSVTVKTKSLKDNNYFGFPASKQEIKVYEMDVHKLERNKTYKINCIHEDDEEIFKKFSNETRSKIKKEIKKNPISQNEKTEMWKIFYQYYYDLDQPVDYYYALTVYKSQGSTFDNVFVDMTEILNRYKTTHFLQSRELYTAISRAKKTLIIKYDDFRDKNKILRMCARCHKKNALDMDELNKKGKPFKTCQRCRQYKI